MKLHFSFATANPNDAYHVGQVADMFGDDSTFVFEDMRMDKGSDRDYNDLVFHVKGATGNVVTFDQLIADGLLNPQKDFRHTEIGQQIAANANPYIADGKTLPGDPLHPALPVPVIPHTDVDQGGNGFSGVIGTSVEPNQGGALPDLPTIIKSPLTQDVIDQVGGNDPIDVVNVPITTPVETPVHTETVLPVETVKILPVLEIAPTEDLAHFDSGLFTVGDTGTVTVDFLYDGGSYRGQLAVFSLRGMESLDPNSTEFIREAAARALSNSNLGHIVIDDIANGAHFASSTNGGQYLGAQSFAMDAGDQFGMMLVPHGKVQAVFDNPDVGGIVRPLFSMSTANPNDAYHVGQIADVRGDGSTFVFEDLRVDQGSDRDYNDLVFHVKGATGNVVTFDQLIADRLLNPAKDWRNSDLGQSIAEYVTPPVLPPDRFEFPVAKQPLIGIIDTGFAANNPDINYSNITLGKDYIGNDANPLLQTGEGSEHGTHILGIIGATQDNGIGIDGVNDNAPIWLGRAVGSGEWANSLTEFVNHSIADGRDNAVVNLSMDLTQVNPDGSVTTRYEFTPQERAALEYARQNNVLIVVAAGNDGGTMSALGQASQEFDNIITVGAIDYSDKRAIYSSFGRGLDFVAYGGVPGEPELSTIGSGSSLSPLDDSLRLWREYASGSETTPLSKNMEVGRDIDLAAIGSATGTLSLGRFHDHEWKNQGSPTTPIDITQVEVDENLPDDEMSKIARDAFQETFGESGEVDEAELANLTTEERQAYDEATKEIDLLLNDYLVGASQKLALEYVDGYYQTQVDALSQFVETFDENLAGNLIQAQEILGNAGFSVDIPTDSDASNPLDLGVGWMAGTSVATAKVTGAVSQVWAANPNLNYAQVKEILKRTAIDLNTPGWDMETGSGKINLAEAIKLAETTQPEAYQPTPIISPLIWSGEGKLIAGERAVSISVPQFSAGLLNAGYVNTVGFLRIRSGPGTQYTEVGRKYPGNVVTFDAYENNGTWVPDPYMPNGGSSRWYRIAGTNTWMSALYFNNTPELAEQERQRQEAIRQAEEAARLAEEAARRAEEEARRAEEELRRIEEEQRRIQEQQRLKQEKFLALVSNITQLYGPPGLLLGSAVSNGVTIYQFAQGQLLIQPNGTASFYQSIKSIVKPIDYSWTVFQSADFFRKDLFNRSALSTFVDYTIKTNVTDPQGFWRTLDKISPLTRNIPATTILDGAIKAREILPKVSNVLNTVGNFLTKPVIDPSFLKLGKEVPLVGDVIDLGFLATSLAIGDDKDKRRAQLKLGAMGLAGAIGAGVGALGFGVGAIPVGVGAALAAGTLMDIVYLGFDWTGNSQVLDGAIENSFNAVSSAASNAIEAMKKTAENAKQKAQELAAQAKAAYQTAKNTAQKAQSAYQTFKQDVQKKTTQIVQQSQQKIKEVAQAIAQKVMNNPIVKSGSKVFKQVANYANKAVKFVSNAINSAKQFVSNTIEAGKQFVSNVFNGVQQTYQTVKNFVVNTASTTYNNAVKAVNNVVNNISNGFNGFKKVFGW
ncbi:MAG: DUF4114 domain-containing protein [Pseudanabaena sp. ELA607]